MIELATIYSLDHPELQWRYFGSTTRNVKQRWAEELKAARSGAISPWPLVEHLRDLMLNEHRLPIGHVLEQCPKKERYSREAEYAAWAMLNGFYVVNGDNSSEMRLAKKIIQDIELGKADVEAAIVRCAGIIASHITGDTSGESSGWAHCRIQYGRPIYELLLDDLGTVIDQRVDEKLSSIIGSKQYNEIIDAMLEGWHDASNSPS